MQGWKKMKLNKHKNQYKFSAKKYKSVISKKNKSKKKLIKEIKNKINLSMKKIKYAKT